MIEALKPHDFLRLMTEKGYVVNTIPFRLNIVGFRDKKYQPDTFNDVLALYSCTASGKWFCDTWPITTLPGKPSLWNPLNKKGCAILVPGQYENAYELGLHKGKYEALVQALPVKVYRDNNRDSSYDLTGEIDTGFFGINIHKAGVFSKIVGVSSAGCQVFQKAADFDKFIRLCKGAARPDYMFGKPIFLRTPLLRSDYGNNLTR